MTYRLHLDRHISSRHMMYTFSPLFSVIFVFGTIHTLPSHRFRRQASYVANLGSSGRQSSAWLNAPSGSIGGTAYYGKDPSNLFSMERFILYSQELELTQTMVATCQT